MTGVCKDIGNLKAMIKEAQKVVDVPAQKKFAMTKMLDAELKSLMEISEKLETAHGHEALSAAVVEAEAAVELAKQQMKAWKDMCKTYEPK